MASLIHSGAAAGAASVMLWLVGNGLSDTLANDSNKFVGRGSGWLGMASLIHSPLRAMSQLVLLWLVGNGLSDTLNPIPRPESNRALAGWEWPL